MLALTDANPVIETRHLGLEQRKRRWLDLESPRPHTALFRRGKCRTYGSHRIKLTGMFNTIRTSNTLLDAITEQ